MGLLKIFKSSSSSNAVVDVQTSSSGTLTPQPSSPQSSTAYRRSSRPSTRGPLDDLVSQSVPYEAIPRTEATRLPFAEPLSSSRRSSYGGELPEDSGRWSSQTHGSAVAARRSRMQDKEARSEVDPRDGRRDYFAGMSFLADTSDSLRGPPTSKDLEYTLLPPAPTPGSSVGARGSQSASSLLEPPQQPHHPRPQYHSLNSSPLSSPVPSSSGRRRAPLISPSVFRAKSSDALSVASQRAAEVSPSAPSSPPSTARRSGRVGEEKVAKQRRGLFGIKAFGGSRMDLSSQDGKDKMLPSVPPTHQAGYEDSSELKPPPSRTSVFSSSRTSLGNSAPSSPVGSQPGSPDPVRNVRQGSATSLPVPPNNGSTSGLPTMSMTPMSSAAGLLSSSSSLLRGFEVDEPASSAPLTDRRGSKTSLNAGFPWTMSSRERSKSPGPSDTAEVTDVAADIAFSPRHSMDSRATASNPAPSSSGLLAQMSTFGKVRSRSKDVSAHGHASSKSRGKMESSSSSSPPLVVVPLDAEDDDPSFQLRSFRHVSSGSGMEPRPEISYVPANTQARNRSSASRPNSVAQESERKVSVQLFRQSRRWSTASSNGGGVSQANDESINMMQREESQEELRASMDMEREQTVKESESDMLRRLSKRRRNMSESGVEMLISPEKKRPEASASAEGANKAKRSLPRSVSTSALVEAPPTVPCGSMALQDSGFVVSRRRQPESEPPTPTQAAQECDPSLARQPTVNKYRRPALDIDTNRRQADTWYGRTETADISHAQRDCKSQPASPTSSPMILRTTSPDVITSADGTGSAKALQSDLGVEPRSRLPLHARLASVTSATTASAIPDPTCEIPPVTVSPPEGSRSASPPPRSAAGVTVVQRPLSILKPTHPRSVSSVSQSKAKVPKNGWDLSSSDDDSELSSGEAARIRRNFSKLRTGSMPSGLRRPPPTSVAFSDSKTPAKAEPPVKSVSSSNLPAGVPSVKLDIPSPARSAAPPSADNSAPFLPGKPKAAGDASTAGRRQSSSESEEDTTKSSSEDEVLSTFVKRKSSAMTLATTSKLAQPAGGVRKLSGSDGSSISPTSSTRTATPRRAAPLRPPPSTGARSSSHLSKLSMGPSIVPFGGAGSPPLVGPVRPFGLTTAGQVVRESPASSQSGTTGETSSAGAPLTPREGSSGSDVGIVSSNATDSGRPDGSKSSMDRGSRGRRVSFMDTDWSSANDAEAERKRKERRREEAKQAIERGNALNGTDVRPPQTRDLPDQEVFNPYLGGRPPSMDAQQMLAMQMQMAQVNPAYMQQMHQYAMMLAKQQYQASVAAAALQAANDEWERSSTMTGFNPASSPPGFPLHMQMPIPGMYGMPQYPMMVNPGGMPMGAASVYGGGGSVYGGGGGGYAGSHIGTSPQRWAASSVYGESFGPPSMPRSTSAPRLPTPQRQRSGAMAAAATSTSDAQAGRQQKHRAPSASMSLLAGQQMPSKSTSATERSRHAGESATRANVISTSADVDGQGPPSAGSVPPSSWRGGR